MTPVQKLGYRPDDFMVVHKIGHVLVGLDLMIPGEGIVISRDRTDYLPRYLTQLDERDEYLKLRHLIAALFQSCRS